MLLLCPQNGARNLLMIMAAVTRTVMVKEVVFKSEKHLKDMT